MTLRQTATPVEVREPAGPFRSPDHPAIVPIRAFDDNYIWMIGRVGAAGAPVIVVDPGDAGPVIRTLDAAGAMLAGILITHHHRDHTGGIDALLSRWPQARVVGPRQTPHPGIGERVGDGDRVVFAAPDLAARVMTVPGHTLDHVAFFCEQVDGRTAPVVFCGDTLFAAGCGRLFEGTPADMAGSLARLASLPADTAVYCAHEYTLANLRFARAAEPGNAVLEARLTDANRLRAADRETVPSTIGIERATNPFLRSTTPAVVETLAARGESGGDAVGNFAALRRWKDGFRG